MQMREDYKNSLEMLFRGVGEDYSRKGLVDSLEFHQEHDVHVYLRLSQDPNKVVHIQGYPGFSDPEGTAVSFSVLDFNRMQDIRVKGEAAIGNEHAALIHPAPNSDRFFRTEDIPWSVEWLEARLAEIVPELHEVPPIGI